MLCCVVLHRSIDDANVPCSVHTEFFFVTIFLHVHFDNARFKSIVINRLLNNDAWLHCVTFHTELMCVEPSMLT